MTHRPTLTGTHTHGAYTPGAKKNKTQQHAAARSAWSPARRKVEDRKQKNCKQARCHVLYLADLGWQMVQERDWQPQWLSAHVVTVVLVTALKFFFVAISTS